LHIWTISHPPQGAHTSHLRTLSKISITCRTLPFQRWNISFRVSRSSYIVFPVRQHRFEKNFSNQVFSGTPRGRASRPGRSEIIAWPPRVGKGSERLFFTSMTERHVSALPVRLFPWSGCIAAVGLLFYGAVCSLQMCGAWVVAPRYPRGSAPPFPSMDDDGSLPERGHIRAWQVRRRHGEAT
jgi:hypothetical protein